MKSYNIYERFNLIIAEYMEYEDYYWKEHDIVLNISDGVFYLKYYGTYDSEEYYEIEIKDCTQMEEDELFQYSLIFYFEHLDLNDISTLQKAMKSYEDEMQIVFK